MKYTLTTKTTPGAGTQKTSLSEAARNLAPLLADEKRPLLVALGSILLNAVLNLCGPLLVGHTIDTYIQAKQYTGVLVSAGMLLGMYLIALVSAYIQTSWMGGVGQRVLFKLRNAIFLKLQELPVAFFAQNKAGDLISRINNDTDKLNMFFSQTLMQFIGSMFIMLGAGIFLIVLHPRLGLAALLPALLLLVFTQATSAWIKRQNTKSLQSTGGLSSEIQESLQNFKVIVAFDRRDYFQKRFAEINQQTYQTAIGASLANTLFTPVFGFFSNLAQLMVLAYGLVLVLQGSFTIGLLISFLAYVNNFYSPLRQLAALWSSFQVALAGWERVSEILALKTDLETIKDRPLHPPSPSNAILAFQAVSFCYPDGKEVLRNISFALEKGKTYALVGPTGGGKTTTASLMARLYDPTDGIITLGGRDIRTYTPAERSQKIGFILQEPFLFSGTVGDNLIYGNAEYQGYTLSQLESLISERGLSALIQRFEQGLATPIAHGGERMSLGERQLIAFMRAVLRRPDILILDEATANVDTLTEQLLEEILKNLPHETTRIIIAHRLNTIEHADEIFFVNGGEMTPAGSLEHAVQLLMQEKRAS